MPVSRKNDSLDNGCKCARQGNKSSKHTNQFTTESLIAPNSIFKQVHMSWAEKVLRTSAQWHFGQRFYIYIYFGPQFDPERRRRHHSSWNRLTKVPKAFKKAPRPNFQKTTEISKNGIFQNFKKNIIFKRIVNSSQTATKKTLKTKRRKGRVV